MKYACWRLVPPCPEGRRALEEAGLPSLLAGVLSLLTSVAGLPEVKKTQ